eukprot:4876454-Amphidinium_carterae.1
MFWIIFPAASGVGMTVGLMSYYDPGSCHGSAGQCERLRNSQDLGLHVRHYRAVEDSTGRSTNALRTASRDRWEIVVCYRGNR